MVVDGVGLEATVVILRPEGGTEGRDIAEQEVVGQQPEPLERRQGVLIAMPTQQVDHCGALALQAGELCIVIGRSMRAFNQLVDCVGESGSSQPEVAFVVLPPLGGALHGGFDTGGCELA